MTATSDINSLIFYSLLQKSYGRVLTDTVILLCILCKYWIKPHIYKQVEIKYYSLLYINWHISVQ